VVCGQNTILPRVKERWKTLHDRKTVILFFSSRRGETDPDEDVKQFSKKEEWGPFFKDVWNVDCLLKKEERKKEDRTC